MRNRVALTAAVAMAAVAVLPAHATSSAGIQRSLQTSFEVRGSDGLRYAFELHAMETGAGQGLASELLLDLKQCTAGGSCKVLAKARLRLAEGSVRVAPDLSSGTLRATVGGLRLAVDLTHVNVETAPPTVHNPGLTIYGLETASGPSPRADVTTDATGKAGLGKTSCVAQGFLYTYQGVDQKGEDVRDPRSASLRLSSRVLKALGAGRCLR